MLFHVGVNLELTVKARTNKEWRRTSEKRQKVMWSRTKFRMRSFTVCTLHLIAYSGDQTTKNAIGGASRTHRRDDKGKVVLVLTLLSTTPRGSGFTDPRNLDLDTTCRWASGHLYAPADEISIKMLVKYVNGRATGVDGMIILKWILMM
jgi:hypothetical protein